MRNIYILALSLLMASGAAAEITGWWGQVSFRQRAEDYKEYFDVNASEDSLRGKVRLNDLNSRTRLGYQIGFKMDVRDNVAVGVTLRSGLGSVMWQDIDNENGLLPGVQEAYIDWQTPYLNVQAGKVPQQGNAMWDLYAAPLWIDFRQDDPTDGVFNDRISSVSGLKVQVPVEMFTLRGTYHTDYVGGYLRKQPYQDDSVVRSKRDEKVYLLGAEVRLGEYLAPYMLGFADDLEFNLDGDLGIPQRAGDQGQAGKDSSYADEFLYGINLRAGVPRFDLQFGYGYNARDSVFTAYFRDYKATVHYEGIHLTGRYQHNTQWQEFGIYKGHLAVRKAYHIYLNYELWGLDLQPRYIWFITKIAGYKYRTNGRMEITATVRF